LPAKATNCTSRCWPGSKRTAVRFEPGQQREVQLVAFAGKREVYGFRGEVMGALEKTA